MWGVSTRSIADCDVVIATATYYVSYVTVADDSIVDVGDAVVFPDVVADVVVVADDVVIAVATLIDFVTYIYTLAWYMHIAIHITVAVYGARAAT